MSITTLEKKSEKVLKTTLCLEPDFDRIIRKFVNIMQVDEEQFSKSGYIRDLIKRDLKANHAELIGSIVEKLKRNGEISESFEII